MSYLPLFVICCGKINILKLLFAKIDRTYLLKKTLRIAGLLAAYESSSLSNVRSRPKSCKIEMSI